MDELGGTGPEWCQLPPTLGAREVAELWGVARWAVYEHATDGQLPVPPIKIGRALRWPTTLVLASVGLDAESVSRALSR